MTSSIRFLFQFVLFRASPADAPAQPQFFWASAVFAVLVNFIMDAGHADIGTSLLFAIMQVVVLGLLIHILLTFRKRIERWRQTTASLYGGSALINLAAWPFFATGASGVPGGATASNAQPSGIAVAAAIFMTVWFIALMARTLHIAMDIRPAFAFLITFLCLMISGVILLNLFPVPLPVKT